MKLNLGFLQKMKINVRCLVM